MRALVAAGLLIAVAVGCRGNTAPLSTEFDIVLDSLTPGLRLRDSGTAVKRKMPSVALVSYSVVNDSARSGRYGVTELALYFDRSQSMKEYQPLDGDAILEQVFLRFADSSGYSLALQEVERWMGRPPLVQCIKYGDQQILRREWRSATGGYLYAFRYAPGGRFEEGFHMEFASRRSSITEIRRGCGLTAVGD